MAHVSTDANAPKAPKVKTSPSTRDDSARARARDARRQRARMRENNGARARVSTRVSTRRRRARRRGTHGRPRSVGRLDVQKKSPVTRPRATANGRERARETMRAIGEVTKKISTRVVGDDGRRRRGGGISNVGSDGHRLVDWCSRARETTTTTTTTTTTHVDAHTYTYDSTHVGIYTTHDARRRRRRRRTTRDGGILERVV